MNDEFSDNTNMMIILVLLLFFYFIVRSINMIVMTKVNWKSVKCDPFYMLMGSIIDTFLFRDKTQMTFDKCVEKISKNKLYNEHQKYMEKNSKTLENNLDKLLEENKGKFEDIDLKNSELLDLISNTNKTIDDTINTQNKINETIIKTSEPIKNLSDQIKNVSTKFKETMQSFFASDIVTNMTNSSS